MDYEKEYKRIVGKIKNAYLYAQTDSTKAVLEEIFPELAESEDEKIRKWLINDIKQAINGDIYNDENIIDAKKALAFLEKQGKQKDSYTTIVETGDGGINALVTRELPTDDYNDKQKPADTVKPKFHEGEWITNGDYTWKIVEIKPLDYMLQSQGDNIVVDTISHVDEQFHSFTIADAKDGDVLAASDDSIFIFSHCEEDGCVHHVALANDGIIVVNKNLKTHWESKIGVRPATKEQRELLFQKMHEAGYTFDFEKKELKKMDQKLCIIQWKGDNLKEVIGFTGKDKNFDKWFASFEEYERYVHEHNNIFKLFNKDGSHYEVPVGAWIVKTPDGYNVASKAVLKQKPVEWSEEDEKRIKKVMHILSLDGRISNEELKSILDWLKSLRLQSTWKPSDEQIRCLKEVVAHRNLCGLSETALNELLSDLKKLKEGKV